MVGIHEDDIIVSGAHGVCDEVFGQLKRCFPMKTLGALNMYTGCAFARGWDSGILEMKQTAFVENMVERNNFSIISNIPEGPGTDIGQRKNGEPGGNEKRRR